MRETMKAFVDRYRVENTKYHLSGDYLYNQYKEKIYPYLGLITKYQNLETPINQEELRISFGVSHNVWRACKDFFPEFKEKLGYKRSIMKLRSEMALQHALEVAPANPKLIEMNFKMYNDEFIEKGNSVDITLPETLKITFEDASMDDDELSKYSKDIIGD